VIDFEASTERQKRKPSLPNAEPEPPRFDLDYLARYAGPTWCPGCGQLECAGCHNRFDQLPYTVRAIRRSGLSEDEWISLVALGWAQLVIADPTFEAQGDLFR